MHHVCLCRHLPSHNFALSISLCVVLILTKPFDDRPFGSRVHVLRCVCRSCGLSTLRLHGTYSQALLVRVVCARSDAGVHREEPLININSVLCARRGYRECELVEYAAGLMWSTTHYTRLRTHFIRFRFLCKRDLLATALLCYILYKYACEHTAHTAQPHPKSGGNWESAIIKQVFNL